MISPLRERWVVKVEDDILILAATTVIDTMAHPGQVKTPAGSPARRRGLPELSHAPENRLAQRTR